MKNNRFGRREFLCLTARAGGLLGVGRAIGASEINRNDDTGPCSSPNIAGAASSRIYNGAALQQIAFPMGGLGAGMICLGGTGALSKFSLHHRPNLTSEYRVFAAIFIQGLRDPARVLEGPVPEWRLRPQFPGEWGEPPNACWGLPRFRHATFEARFPFAIVRLEDEKMPLGVTLTGWSPFSPGDADNASLPVVGLEYSFSNRSQSPLDSVFSFNAENFMAAPRNAFTPSPSRSDRILPTPGGFVLYGPGAQNRSSSGARCAIWVEEPNAKVNYVWFQGEWFDQMQVLWNDIASGKCEVHDAELQSGSPGASIFVPFKISPGETKTIRLYLAWYVPESDLFEPDFRFREAGIERIEPSAQTYQPWYAGRFRSIADVQSYWQSHYEVLRKAAAQFNRTFYDSTLPPEVLEAVSANLTTLKSPTVLRQIDGRLWGWEGCYDQVGASYGSSNHVWNYAQAIAHLFPDLERSLRETELGPNLGKDGFQAIRAALPIRPIGDKREDGFGYSAAADGQLGGIIKLYRDWRITGDTGWLRRLWPHAKASLDYCIRTWDPLHRGWIEEPHMNTYDVEFWGPDSLCTSLYLGALKAATLMGEALGDNVHTYAELLARSVQKLEQELFNGEYFIQRSRWTGLRASFPPQGDDSLAVRFRQYPSVSLLAQQEGPPYQYGSGCLSDGVMGAWLCLVCGVGEILDRSKVERHLSSVFRYNFERTLMDHADQLRSFFACGEEAGLLVCSWPKGGRPSLSFTYADEVWTGTEYQVASHLITLGHVEEGLEIVRACRRRYDGRVRNPFSEVEDGHWYARAMSSYALLQAFSGARFDAVEQILHLKPIIRGDFRCFLSTATGYGTVGVRNGQPFVEVVSGTIPYRRIEYTQGQHYTSHQTPNLG